MLETHTITCPKTGFARELRVLEAPGAKHLAVFLDGEFYLGGIGAPPILTGLVEYGAIPPMHFLFVSHVDAQARLVDYVWNESYARFVGETVLDWAFVQFPDIDPSDHLIAGVSLSALQAALVALRYPIRFSRALCQSGSFWWLEDNPRELPATSQRFWLSVGDQETDENVTHMDTLYQRVSQIAGVETMVARLRSCGGDVRLQPYAGGHALEPWERELPAALAWLYTSP